MMLSALRLGVLSTCLAATIAACGGGGGSGEPVDAGAVGDAAAAGGGGSAAGAGGSAAGAGGSAAGAGGSAAGAGGGAGAPAAGAGGATAGAAGASATVFEYDDGAERRTADTSQTYFVTASLAKTQSNDLLTVRAAQLNPNAAGVKGSFQIAIFKSGALQAGTAYACGVDVQMTNSGTSVTDVHQDRPGGNCTVTLSAVPVKSGDRAVGTFSGTLKAAFGTTTKTITNGRFDVAASVSSSP